MRAGGRWAILVGVSLLAGGGIFLAALAFVPEVSLLSDGPCKAGTATGARSTGPPERVVELEMRDNETFVLEMPAGVWRWHLEAEGARFGLVGESGHVVVPGFVEQSGGSHCAREARTQTYRAQGDGSFVARFWEVA